MMKLIDNRYKVDKVLEDNLYSSVYEVIDFWNNDRRQLMRLYNLDRQKQVIDYFIYNFIFLSKTKHKFLLASDQFNVINTIDRKRVNIKQYYSTTEYIETPSLNKIKKKLHMTDKLKIIQQVCTVVDFLHYKGLVYKHLSPSNIFLLENGDIKLNDLTTIYERAINIDYDDLTRYFIAPEVILEYEEVNKKVDFYSLGMLIKYLLTEDFYTGKENKFNYIDDSQLNDGQIDFLNKTIIGLTKKNPITREGSLREIIDNINNIFDINYEYDLVEERGTLNFETKIVGRENEIKMILKIDDDFVNNKFDQKAILIKGDSGVGKTRFLKEAAHLLKMRGRDVFYSEITEGDNVDLKPMTNILRQTIKDVPKDLLEKYGKELVKVLPELKFLLGVDSYRDINEDRERLRLYDRITNYLEELSIGKPIYLIIDNIENCNLQFLFLLDYIVTNVSHGTVLLITSYNKKMMRKRFEGKEILDKWTTQVGIEEIKLPKLDLSEIGELIQHILGINYKPLKFSAVMLKESQGNPRYIEYMMKDLYATKELFFGLEGFWEIKTQKYSDIYFPTNMDEVLKNQISLIEKKHMGIMNILSIYRGSMSKATLSKMLKIDNQELKENLEQLIGMRLLDERVGDWGYSYSIYNTQFKKLIYYQIPFEERIQLHKRVAQLLEGMYKNNYKPIMDELIFHLISSNQSDKALEYIIQEAREDADVYNSQSILLWEEAYEIVKDRESEFKFEILENLGNIYAIRGENDKALAMFRELLDESNRLNRTKYTIKANIEIGEIYLKRNLLDLALKRGEESRSLSEEEGYLDGLIGSQILHNKILLNNGKLDEVEENMEKLMEFSIANNTHAHLGDIYNILGLVKYFKGSIDEAILNYEKSISSFHNVGRFVDSTKPINNIGNIYSEYHGNKKEAMKYYEEGLKIVQKYGFVKVELIFLNNIGEIFISLCDYKKAKEYIEKARSAAIETEDANMIFLTNVNLGLIYLLTCDYDQSYNCYLVLKGSYERQQTFGLEIISQYYNFLGEFYYTFGNWDEALKYSKKTMDICKEFSYKEFLIAKTRIILVNYFKDGAYNKNFIEEIREEYKNKNLIFDRRKALLHLAIIPFLEGDFIYVADIVKEDRKLKEDYSTPSLDYIRKILLYNISQDKDNFKEMLEMMESIKKYNLLSIEMLINMTLGLSFFEKGQHYQSINYLLETLDIIYRLIKKIPDKDLQISYTRSHRGDIIKAKLVEVLESSFNKKVECIYLDDMGPADSIEKFFDYKPLLSIIDDNEFTKITEISHFYEETKDIYSIETLISKLTDDHEYNLRIILKFLAQETFAQIGYILAYDEENNKYVPLSSLNEDISWIPNENLLALANRHDRGVLINNNLGNNVIGLYKEFLPKDTKALICIPIATSKPETSLLKEERRRVQIFGDHKNEGYIYLETDRVFNRFDDSRHKLVSSLANIIYINIENYRLKILSTIDKLTGTFTRKYFENEFGNVLNRAKMNNESLAILMVDIDKFKNVNDTYGHRKGDEALNKIGSSLISSIRNTDLVARYGGEEFIILLKDVAKDEAKEVAEKIRKNIESIRITKVEHPITVSIGISMFPKHSQFKEELIEKADQALYRAKEKGRNLAVVWDTRLANTLNRVDKLAGILSGNTNHDQRNILAMLDVIDLVKRDNNKEEKIFEFLGRLIETLEAENCVLIQIDENTNQENIYSRSRLNQEWAEKPFINDNIVQRVIDNRKGEFLIDWENLSEMNLFLNTPNWHSVIAIPLEFNRKINCVIYITVPIKEKEFDYNSYNLAKTLCDVFSTIV